MITISLASLGWVMMKVWCHFLVGFIIGIIILAPIEDKEPGWVQWSIAIVVEALLFVFIWTNWIVFVK